MNPNQQAAPEGKIITPDENGRFPGEGLPFAEELPPHLLKTRKNIRSKIEKA
jgi:hypothetical protein